MSFRGISNKHKILIVDDDKDILELLKYNLQKDGYQVFIEKHSKRALDTAIQVSPDLIILDIMMPEMNGLELCDLLRRHPDFGKTYIFFLTAKSEKLLQFQAFERGGDDYIEKITGLRALSYKVGAVLKKDMIIRKSEMEIHIKSLRIDRLKKAAYYRGKEIIFSQQEFDLLYFFVQNPRKEITGENLLHNIWGSDIYMLTKSVDTYINNICHKMDTMLIAKVREGTYKLNVFAIR